MKKILHLLKDNKAFNALLNKQNIVVNSSNSEALLIASAFLTLKKDMLIVKSNQYEANLLYKQVSQMIDEALYFPVDESYRIESLAASGELLGQRLGTMYQLTRPGPHLLISHGHSVMRYVPTVDVFKKNCMTLKVGDHIDVYDLQRFLVQAGYMHHVLINLSIFLNVGESLIFFQCNMTILFVSISLMMKLIILNFLMKKHKERLKKWMKLKLFQLPIFFI